LLNSAAVLLFTQGVLILQPTHTPKQKKHGTWAHAGFNDLALSCAIAGLVIIEYNKIAHNGTHFVSPHAILGLITYILILIQGLIGFTQYFVPQIYGGEENAKKLYKYHRVSGYFIFLMLLATVAAATQTDYNKNVLQIKLWAVLVAAAITWIGSRSLDGWLDSRRVRITNSTRRVCSERVRQTKKIVSGYDIRGTGGEARTEKG
jgi:hypothetical protein